MQRSFLKNLLWLQALNWLIKPLWILLIEREIQLQLGDGLYGQYAVHFGIGTLFAVLLDAGLNAYTSREIAMGERLASWKRLLGLRLGLTFIYVAAVVLFSLFQYSVVWNLILLVIINQLLAAGVLVVRAILQGKHQFKFDSIVSVADRFVAIVVLIFVFGLLSNKGIGNHGVEKFLLAQSTGYAVALLAGLWFSRRFSKINDLESAVSEFGSKALTDQNIAFIPWVKSMGWFVILGLTMSAFTRLDIQMLQWFTLDVTAVMELPGDFPKPQNPGFLANGMYAKGYRFLDAALIFSSMLSIQLLPLFSKRISENLELQSLVWMGFRIVFMVSVSAAVVGYFYGAPLMGSFYHLTQYAEVYNMGQLFFGFMLVFIAMSTVHVFGTLLTAAGDVKWLSFLAFVCLAVNIGVDSMQIPMLGPFGALEGSMITQGLFAVGCIYRAHRKRLFEWKWDFFEFFVYQIAIPVVVFFAIKSIFGYGTTMNKNTMVALLTSLIISMVLMIYINFGAEIKRWKSDRK